MYISKMKKKFNNFFFSLDNIIWMRSFKFQILQREYLSPAVNVLTKSGKISNITNKRGFPSQSYSEIQHNFMKVLSWRFHKCRPSTMLTWNGGMKRGYLNICVTMPFTICNFPNRHTTRVNLYSKCLKFYVDSRNWIKY